MKNFETAPANATIRKDSGFVMDFAPRDIQIDAEVAELAQFECRLATARGRKKGQPCCEGGTQISRPGRPSN